MRTLIAIPCMDMVHTNFLKSILGMRKVGEVQFQISCSSLIYDARNGLVKRAIEGGFDRILWLDSDMDFDPDLMERLSADLDEGREYVTALFFKRKAPIKPCIYSELAYIRNENGTLTPIAVCMEDYPQDQVFEIAASGFAATMMTVGLAKRVQEKFGQPFSPQLGFGEDLSFCGRAKQVGAQMWCDSRIKVGHVGYGVISESTYLSTRSDENADTC